MTPALASAAQSLANVAASTPDDDPSADFMQREAEGMRPGGYGSLLASGTVDELIYSEIGNEVLLIKYVDSDLNPSIGYRCDFCCDGVVGFPVRFTGFMAMPSKFSSVLCLSSAVRGENVFASVP